MLSCLWAHKFKRRHILLKFQNNHATEIEAFENFILTVFVIIDDLHCKYAPQTVSRRCRIRDAKLSESEIITISVCDEFVGVDSENTLFSFIKRNYRHPFLKLCSQPRFNRMCRNHLQVMKLLQKKLLCGF